MWLIQKKNVEQNAHAVKTNASLILGLNLDLKKLVDIHSCQKMFAQQQIEIVYAFARDIFFRVFLCSLSTQFRCSVQLNALLLRVVCYIVLELWDRTIKGYFSFDAFDFFSFTYHGYILHCFSLLGTLDLDPNGEGGMYSGENISTQWNGKSFLVCLLW